MLTVRFFSSAGRRLPAKKYFWLLFGGLLDLCFGIRFSRLELEYAEIVEL